MEWHPVGDDRGWIYEKTRLVSDFSLEVSLSNRDGNSETCWLPPPCLGNRNNSAFVTQPHLPFQNKSKKPMSTKICAGSIWATSTCVAGLWLASRRRTLSAAVCMARPGGCSVPSVPWKTQVSPYPGPAARGHSGQVALTSLGPWQFSYWCIFTSTPDSLRLPEVYVCSEGKSRIV